MKPTLAIESGRSRHCVVQTPRRKLRMLLYQVCLSLALPLLVGAPTLSPSSAPAPLPPEKQEALKKGIIAAKQQDYLLAICYFQAAGKTQDWRSRSNSEPDTPEIYFNLGLAESKLPGRELRAICWFETYLAASQNAPNAAAVKDQIDILDVKSQSNLSRFFQLVQDAAINIPIDNERIVGLDRYPSFDRDSALGQVSALWSLLEILQRPKKLSA